MAGLSAFGRGALFVSFFRTLAFSANNLLVGLGPDWGLARGAGKLDSGSLRYSALSWGSGMLSTSPSSFTTTRTRELVSRLNQVAVLGVAKIADLQSLLVWWARTWWADVGETCLPSARQTSALQHLYLLGEQIRLRASGRSGSRSNSVKVFSSALRSLYLKSAIRLGPSSLQGRRRRSTWPHRRGPPHHPPSASYSSAPACELTLRP